MEQNTELEIIMVSGACCAPNLARTEENLEKQLKETVEQLELDASVRVVSLGAVLNGDGALAEEQSRLVHALFQKYGVKFAPAGLIDTRVLFAGGAPAPDKLKQMMKTL